MLLALLLALAPVGHAAHLRAEPPAAPARPSSAVQKELDRLATWVEAEKGELSAQIVEVDGRQVIAEKNPGLLLNPASNAKVPTAAAVLAKLGADFRFKSGL